MSLEGKSKDITVNLPSLVGTQEFAPTAIMIQTLCAYLEAVKQQDNSSEPPSATDILVSLGHARQNWYMWKKRPLFMDWWDKACNKFYQSSGLNDVYSAIYRNAVTNSQADRKLYLERFDKQYKPASSQEHTFPGVAPPEQVGPAIERSRQRARQLQDGSNGK